MTKSNLIPRKGFLSALLGTLLAGAFEPIAFPFLAIPVLVLWMRLLEGETVGQTFRHTFLFAFCFYLVSCYWIAFATVTGVFFALVYLALVYAILMALGQWIHHRLKVAFPWIFVLSWMIIELVLSFGEMAFPWMLLGYSLSRFVVFLQIAEWGGVWLVSLALLMTVVLLAHKKTRLWTIAWLLIWMLVGNYLQNRVNEVETDLTIAIVQPAIRQDMKWDEHYYDAHFYRFEQYARQYQDADLILFPETAYIDYIRVVPHLFRKVQHFARHNRTNIISGFLDYEATYHEDGRVERKYYNGAGFFDQSEGLLYTYHKNHLVPAGEKVPFREIFPFLEKIPWFPSSFDEGAERTVFPFKGYHFALNICFEDVLPGLLRQDVLQGADVLVNLTNDAWFLISPEPFQHYQAAKMRAIETRRTLLRTNNTGFSFAISPSGKTIVQTKLFEEEVLKLSLPVKGDSQQTVFVRYGFYWIWVLVGLEILAILLSLIIMMFQGKRGATLWQIFSR